MMLQEAQQQAARRIERRRLASASNMEVVISDFAKRMSGIHSGTDAMRAAMQINPAGSRRKSVLYGCWLCRGSGMDS
jgi:hypothetical protein